MFSLFPITPERLARHQLKEAQLQRLEHEKAAEYHRSIADMLKARCVRLESQLKGLE